MPRPGVPPLAPRGQVRLLKRPIHTLGVASTVTVLVLLACSNPKVATTASGPKPDFATFAHTVQPFLAEHCYECHDDKDTEGNVRLDIFKDEASLAKGMPTIEKAIKMLTARKMPPKEEPRPTEDDYGKTIAWMNAYTTKFYMSGPIDPGRVTLHRLNRAEYDNTIRDLLHLDDFHPADSFPSDDAGYGFDNNSDVLSIAPVLFEKYIKAAQVSLETAVFTDPTIPPPSKQWDAATAEGDFPKSDPKATLATAGPNPGANALIGAVANADGANASGANGAGNGVAGAAGQNGRGGRGGPPPVLGRVFQYQGYIYASYDFPGDGDYIFSFKGYVSGGAQGGFGGGGGGRGGATANALFFLDGDKPVGSDDRPIKVTARAGMPAEYVSPKIHVTAGKHTISLAFRSGALKDDYDKALAAAADAAKAAASAPAPSTAAPATDPATVPTAVAPAAPVPATSSDALSAAAPVVATTNVIAAADPAANSGGSDPAASAAPVINANAAADPAAANNNAAPAANGRRNGRANGAGGANGAFGGQRGRGGFFAGPASVTGQPILGVISFKVDGPQFVDAATMPDRMPLSYKSVMLTQPSPTLTKAAAAEKIIRNFATRAYRRPVTDDEVKSLMALWTSVDAANRPLEKTVTVALQAVLLNPNFLFRVEQDPQPGEKNNIHNLNEYELASRLSYFLWSSMPDDELFNLAAKGQLHANLDAQVTRMLKDPKASALVDNFAGQWLQLRKVDDVNPDTDRFKAFTPEIKPAMLKETQLFFKSIMDEDRSVLDFINANYSFVNEPLAKLYGIDGVTGDAFQRVTFPKDSPRGGLVTQASILAITSYNNRTSPVQRGKWVLENLLDSAPPPPPPNVPALADDHKAELTGTLKKRMEEHRANPTCASCHERMDAIGFSLENFDVMGAWRTTDTNNDPIDASGTFPDGTKFSGAKELKQTLMASSDQFCRCLAGKMYTYALGRSTEPFDKRTLDDIVSTMHKQGDKFSALIHAVVHSAAFQQRRGNPTGDQS